MPTEIGDPYVEGNIHNGYGFHVILILCCWQFNLRMSKEPVLVESLLPSFLISLSPICRVSHGLTFAFSIFYLTFDSSSHEWEPWYSASNRLWIKSSNAQPRGVDAWWATPPSKSSPRKRSRHVQHSEILTASPFKKSLEAKEEAKKIKLGKELAKGKPPKKTNDKTKRKNRSAKSNPWRNATSEPSCYTTHPEHDETYLCIYCEEKYEDPPSEDWLQCVSCGKWYHEKCGSGDANCDLCQSKDWILWFCNSDKVYQYSITLCILVKSNYFMQYYCCS